MKSLLTCRHIDFPDPNRRSFDGNSKAFFRPLGSGKENILDIILLILDQQIQSNCLMFQWVNVFHGR